MKIFRAYLLGHHCVVYTDHSACTSLLNAKHPSPKLARWAMAIQEMDLDIRHRAGKGNLVADALSRNPVSKDSSSNSSGQVFQVDSEPPIATKAVDAKLQSQDSEIGQLQQKDEEFAPIFRYLEDGILPDDEHKAKKLALEKSRFDVIENFQSELMNEVCKLVGTVKINTAGYHPQCDGLVEKFNSTIINMLSKCVEKHGRDWDDHLPYLLFAYRVAVQESTQESPFFLLYGRDPRVPTETALTQPSTSYQVEFPDY